MGLKALAYFVRTAVVLRGDLLAFRAVKEVQVGLGVGGRTLLGHGALDHGHRVLGHDGGAGVDRIDLALAELVVHRYDLGFKRHQHVADVALQEDAGGIAPAARQHRHVLVELAHELGGLRVGAALGAHLAPGGQVGHAAVATGLGVDHHHLHAGLDQVVPVLDALGVALAHQEQHGGRGGRGVVREFLAPVLGHHALLGQEVHVGGGVHGHHVGVQTVGHGARLGTRPGVRLVHLDVLAGGLLVMRHEGGVQVLVELARHVVGHVEQRGLGRGCGGGGKRDGAEGVFEKVLHGNRAPIEGMHGILKPRRSKSNDFVFVFLFGFRIKIRPPAGAAGPA
jgi:hypothetical protein